MRGEGRRDPRRSTDADVEHQQELADLLADQKVLPGRSTSTTSSTRGLIDRAKEASNDRSACTGSCPPPATPAAILGAGGNVGAHHRRAGDATGERAPDIDYLGQIARSAEQLGFEAALTPTGSWCEDAWVTTAGADARSPSG